MLGDKIKEIRKSNNLTQEQFGELFGVAKNTVSYWEANTSKPDYDIIRKISEHFNVTPNYLYGFNQEDLDNIERLKTVFKEAGMWDEKMNDITMEDFQKALQIIAMLKEKKDTNK